MKAVIQRVKAATVRVGGECAGEIGQGLLVLLGITHTDTVAEVDWLAHKLVNLRIFQDEAGLMNRSLLDINGAILVVSQFTLYGDARKGHRPSFTAAARPEVAEPLYSELLARLRLKVGVERVAGGVFGAEMEVELVNAGPVTIVVEREAG